MILLINHEERVRASVTTARGAISIIIQSKWRNRRSASVE